MSAASPVSTDDNTTLATASEAIFQASEDMPPGSEVVAGFDFHSYARNPSAQTTSLIQSLKSTGFQATNVGLAIDELNTMLSYRGPPEDADGHPQKPPKATIFLGFTCSVTAVPSLRQILASEICNKRLVDVIVLTAGSIEEDVIACLASHGCPQNRPCLRAVTPMERAQDALKGIVYVGNISKNQLAQRRNVRLYFMSFLSELFEILPTTDVEGLRTSVGEIVKVVSPSQLLRYLGVSLRKVGGDASTSILVACAQFEESIAADGSAFPHTGPIHVYCPGITDGFIGTLLAEWNAAKGGPSTVGKRLVIDLVADIQAVNGDALRAHKSGMLILGGGIIKHHICNANLFRNGAEWTVFVNTGQEFDGSDSGAKPDEAISWGKCRLGSNPVKVYSEVSIVLPLLAEAVFSRWQSRDICFPNASPSARV